MASFPDTRAASPAAEDLEERFQNLAATWHEAVAHHSSSSIRYNHPLYQEIIALRLPVVPLLLRDLELNRRHWFAALMTLTEANPVPPAEAGNIASMRDAWLKWGRDQGSTSASVLSWKFAT